MLCRHRKASVVSVCGQIDQPFGQGKWANERTYQSVDMAHMHYADLRVVTPSGFPRVRRHCSFNVSRQLQTCRAFASTRLSDGLLLGVHVKLRHRSITGDVHLYGDGVLPSPPRVSQREGGRHLSQSEMAMSIVATDKCKLCRLYGRVERIYRYFNGGILASISLIWRTSSECVVATGSATCRATVRSVTNRRLEMSAIGLFLGQGGSESAHQPS